MKYMQYIAIIIGLLFSLSDLFCQVYSTVYITTPNNTSVEAGELTSGEWSSTKKNSIKNAILDYWGSDSDFEYVDEATHAYNCHAYTWYISEGENEVWINNPNDNEFWDDGSYVKASGESDATKVSYGNCYKSATVPAMFCRGDDDCWIEDHTYTTDHCDHSAITTIDNGVFISKWGSWCLLQHDYDDVPYLIEDDVLLYFKRCREIIDNNITSNFNKTDFCELILDDVTISSGVSVTLELSSYDDYKTINEFIKIEGTFYAPAGSTLNINP